MKIAVLGGGITGLVAAYFLGKKGHQVTVFEKEPTLGGMAAGFKQSNWDWYLEKTVHHLFSNDNDILDFAKEIGFNKIFFKEPETASLYENSEFRIHNSKFLFFPLDTPRDLLHFPLLNWPDKIRTGLVLAFLKFSPFFSFYEKITAEEFLIKSMGTQSWDILWQELFRKKFGKYAENILASFIWARIKKRTKKLGYIEGGFQILINYLENQLKSLRVNTLTSYEINKIERKNFKFDYVVSTLPTPTITKIGEKLFPAEYLNRLKKIKYLHSVSLILETEKPILKKAYWLNICDKKIPIMGIFQQTNFIDKKNYGNKHILYLGWYVGIEDKLWKMNKEEILNLAIPHLQQISSRLNRDQISNFYLFKTVYAQPIFDKEFLKNKPKFETPIKNFYIANLDMTYPYDRGVNYAVKLGKEVNKLF